MSSKKDRGLKTRTQLSNAIANHLFDSLDILKELTRIDKSKLLDEAIEDLIKKYENKGYKIN
jgi:hypothetical protein